MEKLNTQEEMIMQGMWKIGMGAVRDIIEQLPSPPPPYTTVASVVKNLEKKGFLSSRKYGNTYVYAPLVSEEKYKARFMSQVVSRYFENSYKNMVSFFAEKEKISANDLKDIIDMIEKGESS